MDITEQRRDEVINNIAYRIVRHGLVAPAIIFLELNRPLMYIYSQGMHFISPVAEIIFGHSYTAEMGYIFQEQKNIDIIIERIEEFDRKNYKGKIFEPLFRRRKTPLK